MNNRRKGKVARLPIDLKIEVNKQLRDGITYGDIIQFLEGKGHTGFNDENISAWYKGGHQDWLKNQERIEQLTARRDAALELVRDLKQGGEVHITEANELILASQINEALSDFDPAIIRELLAEKPEKFFQLAQAVTSQTNERTKREKLELDYKKYRDTVEEQKRKIQESLNVAKSKGGLTKETLKQIEEAAALL